MTKGTHKRLDISIYIRKTRSYAEIVEAISKTLDIPVGPLIDRKKKEYIVLKYIAEDL